MDEIHAVTLDVLMADAEKLGFPATERLILDWESRGLLAYRTRNSLGYGRGQAPGTWHPVQRELWGALIVNRPKVRKLAPLANIPVWWWLALDDPPVIPVDQVRRALSLWINDHKRLTRPQAKKAAAGILDQLMHPAMGARSRSYRRDELANDLYFEGRVIAREVTRLKDDFDPLRTGRKTGTPDMSFDPEKWAKFANDRIRALNKIPDLSDEQLLMGRQAYRITSLQYLTERPQLEAAAYPESKDMFQKPTLEDLLSRACYDFTSTLALTVTRDD